MLKKPFSVKSNTNVRNSDRRKILSKVSISEFLSPKAVAALVCVRCHNGSLMSIYTFDKEPLLFEAESGMLCPTVYLTWIAPDSFPCLVTNENVLSHLQSGADLMLPGVIRTRGEFPEFGKNVPVTISVVSGSKLIGPVAVGLSLMSSMEMISHGMQGRGVRVLHTVGDSLWEFGSKAQPRSVARTVTTRNCLSEENFPPLGSSTPVEVSIEINQVFSTSDGVGNDLHVLSNSEENIESSQTDTGTMEDLLERCFLAALKYRVTKKAEMPVDVGEFYSRFLLSCVPSNRRLDMKKTVYKKFGTFLKEINSRENGPVVKIASKKKGVEEIVEIYWAHPLLKSFEVSDEKISDDIAVEPKTVKLEEWYAVTEPVSRLFIAHGFNKGSLLQLSQVREIITSYVKAQGMNEGNKVKLKDDILGPLLKISEPTIDWNTLMLKTLNNMTKTFILTTPDGRQFIRKLNYPNVIFKIESRSGNKKVTLVNNLSLYGIDCKILCQQIQVGVATSANIVNNVDHHYEGPQILVQGNQILFISDLLSSEYGIDRKMMKGLEHMQKKRK